MSKSAAKSKTAELDEVGRYLVEKGLRTPEQAMDREIHVRNLQLEGGHQNFIGADYKPDLFRYSFVGAGKRHDANIDRLERLGFVNMSTLDISRSHGGQGTVMGRPLDVDQKIKAERRRQWHKRRAHKRKRSRDESWGSGSTFSMTTDATPMVARGNHKET